MGDTQGPCQRAQLAQTKRSVQNKIECTTQRSPRSWFNTERIRPTAPPQALFDDIDIRSSSIHTTGGVHPHSSLALTPDVGPCTPGAHTMLERNRAHNFASVLAMITVSATRTAVTVMWQSEQPFQHGSTVFWLLTQRRGRRQASQIDLDIV